MESVQVTIFGQMYSIKGGDNPDHVRKLASFIDGKMKEIQKGTGTGDPLRVAILAAMTISDELQCLRDEYNALGKTAESGVKRLLDLMRQPTA